MAKDPKRQRPGTRRKRSSLGAKVAGASRKRRVRPSARANARKAAINQRPMPKPPVRRRVARSSAKTAVSTELASKVGRIEDKFERLESQAQLEDIFTAVGDIDNKLTSLPFDLEALRDRGYVHSGQLEDKLEALDDKWDELRPRVEKAIAEQVDRLDRELDQTERQVNRLSNVSESVVNSVDKSVDSLGSRITAARRALDGLYDGMQTELYQIERSLGQVGKMLDLPYPGGPQVAKLALQGTQGRFRFPRPMTNRPGLDFSFSGLKTFVRNTIAEHSEDGGLDEQTRADIAWAFEDAVVSTLAIKCRRALEHTGLQSLIIAGGVSANQRLREVLEANLRKVHGRLFYAKPSLCTDNGAMIAYAGCQRLLAGQVEDLPISAQPRWNLESLPAIA